jgi:hypothetical protein
MDWAVYARSATWSASPYASAAGSGSASSSHANGPVNTDSRQSSEEGPTA